MIENFDHPKCAVLVCGKSGHGKSTKFNEILDAQSAEYWFIYDHKGEFHKRFGKSPCFSLEGIALDMEKTGIVCFDPARLFPGRKEDGFLFFCDLAFTVSGEFPGRKIFVCDELQQMAYQSRPDELILLMDDGRRRGLDCFFIAQSANQLHNGVINQFTEIMTFTQGTEAAVKPLKNYGFDDEKILALKPGEWIWRNMSTGEEKTGGSAFEIESTAKDYLRTAGARKMPKRNRR